MRKSTVICVILVIMSFGSLFNYPIHSSVQSLPIPAIDEIEETEIFIDDVSIEQEADYQNIMTPADNSTIITQGTYKSVGFFTQDSFVDLDENGYVFEWEKYDDIVDDDYSTYIDVQYSQYDSSIYGGIYWHPLDTYGQLRSDQPVSGKRINSTIFSPVYDTDTYIQGKVFFKTFENQQLFENFWYLRITLARFNPITGLSTDLLTTSKLMDTGSGGYTVEATLANMTIIPAGYRLRTTYEVRLLGASYDDEEFNRIDLRTGLSNRLYDWTVDDTNSTYDNYYALDNGVGCLGMQLLMYQDPPTIELSGFSNNTIYYTSTNATVTTSVSSTLNQYKWDSDSFSSFDSPYTVSLPETYGWHTLTVRASDFFSNVVGSVYNVGFDTNVKATLDTPANNSLVTDGMYLNFTIGSSVTYTTYEWDQNTIQYLLLAPHDILLNSDFDDTHQLTLRTIDDFGTEVFEYYFTFDNSAPVITLQNVLNETTQAQGKNIDIEITDSSYPMDVQYKWDSDDFSSWSSIGSNIYREYLPSTAGWHNLTVQANDTFGYSTMYVFSFNTSLTLLNVDLLSMINGSHYQGGNTVEVNVLNTNGTVKYFWNGDPWSDGVIVDNLMTLSGGDALSSTPGTYILTIIVGNALNEQVEFIFVFYVDQENPTITQTTPIPNYNGTRFLGTQSLSFSIGDNLTTVGDLIVLYSIDEIDNQTLNSPYQIFLDGIADGNHNLTIYAEDLAGNYNFYYITFIIDNTIPTSSVIITGEALDSGYNRYVPANTLVSISMNDADPILNSYYSWNSSDFILFSNNFNLPSVEGYAQLIVKANDSLGLTSTHSYWLTIDGTSPEFNLNFLTNNSKINDITPIRFTVEDISEDTIDYVESQWDLEGSPIIRSSDFNVSLLIAHLSHVEATISLYAIDLVGNENSSIYHFYLDFEAPNYDLLGITNNSYIRGGSIVNFNVISSDVQSFQYKWDSEGEYKTIDDPWNITAPIIDNDHTLYIIIEDNTGGGVYTNKIEANYVFTIDDMELIYISPIAFETNYYHTMCYGDNFTFSVNIRDAINKTEIPNLNTSVIHASSAFNLSYVIDKPNTTVYEITVFADDINETYSSIEFQFFQFAGNRQSVIVNFRVYRKEGTMHIIASPDSVVYGDDITIQFQLRDANDSAGQQIIYSQVEGIIDTHVPIDAVNYIYSLTFSSNPFFTSKGNKTFELFAYSEFYYGVMNDTTSIQIEILPIPIVLTIAIESHEVVFDSNLVVSATLIRADLTPIDSQELTFSFKVYCSNGTVVTITELATTNSNGQAQADYYVTKGIEYIEVSVSYSGNPIYDPASDLHPENIIAISGGLPLQTILIIVGAVVLFVLIMSLVIYRLAKPKPFEELMEKVSEEEIMENQLKMSPGVILSIFDQMKGPIPLIGNHSLEEPNYKPRMRIGVENFLLKICDQAYSSLGFEEHDERRRTGTINLPNEDMVGFIHGVQLENKVMRGGFENLSLIILADSEFGGFLLANQEFLFHDIDILAAALKTKKSLPEVEVLIDAIRRKSVIIMIASKKNAKKDKKDKQNLK